MNITKQSMFNIALSIATEAHRGQFDKAGVDYIKHPLYVASQVVTEELLQAGLPETVVTAVQILSKKEGQDYQTYLENVKSNSLARVVKLADLKHNSDLSRLSSVTDKDLERF